MLFGFPIVLRDVEFFCRNCGELRNCARLSRNLELYSQDNSVVFMLCQTCQNSWQLFSHDFAEYIDVQSLGQTVQIPGISKITVGDWLYLPDIARKGRVSARFRSGDTERFTVELENRRLEIVAPSPQSGLESWLAKGLYLFIDDFSLLKVGLWIFHCGRNQAALVVGLFRQPNREAYLRLQDGSIIKVSETQTELSANPLTPLGSELGQIANEYGVRLSEIRRGEKALYLFGTCDSLQHSRYFLKQIQNMFPDCIIWDEIQIRTLRKRDDLDIEKDVLRKLKQSISEPIIGLTITCKQNELKIGGWIESQAALDDWDASLVEIPGLRALLWEFSPMPVPTSDDRGLKLKLEKSLRESGFLRDKKIFVRCLNGEIFLDGFLDHPLQKQAATVALAWWGRNLKVHNNLWVLPK